VFEAVPGTDDIPAFGRRAYAAGQTACNEMEAKWTYNNQSIHQQSDARESEHQMQQLQEMQQLRENQMQQLQEMQRMTQVQEQLIMQQQMTWQQSCQQQEMQQCRQQLQQMQLRRELVDQMNLHRQQQEEQNRWEFEKENKRLEALGVVTSPCRIGYPALDPSLGPAFESADEDEGIAVVDPYVF